jgi:hypothetical protein
MRQPANPQAPASDDEFEATKKDLLGVLQEENERQVEYDYKRIQAMTGVRDGSEAA